MPKLKNSRNANGAGSIRKRKDGTWEARYTVGRDPGTGKQIQKSVYGKTQKEVRQELQQVCTDIDKGIYTVPTTLTVEQWLDTWLDVYVVNLKPYSIRTYQNHVKNTIKPALGTIKLQKLQPPAIQEMYNKLQAGTEIRPPISAKTVRNIHGTLHAALKQAVELGYIKSNPAEKCKLPKAVRRNITPLGSLTASFIQKINGHKYELLYLTALSTGIRQGEILGLTWDCVKTGLKIFLRKSKVSATTLSLLFSYCCDNVTPLMQITGDD